MLAHKLHELRARRAAGETGFTLVELLVVVVIIVALAAIAVPIFLNQKEKADDAASQSSLSAAAKFISAGISDGSLSEADGTDQTAASATGANITSSSGSFFFEKGMDATWVMSGPGAGDFCVTDGTNKITNTSGGVVAGTTC